MEPNSAPTGSEHIPSPMPKAETLSQQQPEAAPEMAPVAQEALSQSKEAANQNQGMTLPPVAVNDQSTPVHAPAPVPAAQDDSQQDYASGPAQAADIDLIEKEWVNKAKDIIRQTKDDPHAQEKEVSKLQADYLKKRYGKIIKPSRD